MRPFTWLGLVLAAACLEYSPHQLPTDPDEQDLNRKAVERIVSRPVERLCFAVVGDTQRAFEEAEDLVAALNGRDDVQFVVQLGDFTNLAVWLEFRLMNDVFARLRVPYLVVVGFHDLYGNGGAIFEAMFGPTDFAFTHGRARFVLFDSNSYPHGYDGTVPDVPWIEAALAPDAGHDRAFAFSHIAPGGGEHFDDRLTEPLLKVLATGGVELSFHGHAHLFDSYERDGVRIVIADSIEHRSFVLVSQRADGGFDFERVEF